MNIKKHIFLYASIIPLLCCLLSFTTRDCVDDKTPKYPTPELAVDQADCWELHYTAGSIKGAFLNYFVTNHCRETIYVKVQFIEFWDFDGKWHQLSTQTKAIGGGKTELIQHFDDISPQDIRAQVISAW